MTFSERIKSIKTTVTSEWKEAGFQSYAQAQRVAYVVRHGIPWLVSEMDSGSRLPTTAARIAALPPEQQYEILKGNAKPPGWKDKSKPVAEWTMPPTMLKASTFTEKVAAMMNDVKNKRLLDECCGRYGVSRDAYQRGRNIMARNHPDLTAAVNDGVITPGETDRMLGMLDNELAALVERIRIEAAAKKEDPRSKKGNFNVDSLRSLLNRTYVEWRGVSFNVKIDARILPGTEAGLNDMARDAANARMAVNLVMDSLQREIGKCLHKITELNDGSDKWESNGATLTTFPSPA